MKILIITTLIMLCSCTIRIESKPSTDSNNADLIDECDRISVNADTGKTKCINGE